MGVPAVMFCYKLKLKAHFAKADYFYQAINPEVALVFGLILLVVLIIVV